MSNTYKKEMENIFPEALKSIEKYAKSGCDWYNGWPRDTLRKDYKLNHDQLIELFCKREFIWQFAEDIAGNPVPNLTLDELDDWKEVAS
jgi:hypothetical protein